MTGLLLAAVGFYKRVFSAALPASCRFHPTCSDYAREAIVLHGAWRGLGMAAWRLLRCQPLTRGGLDPVRPARRRVSAEIP